MNTMRCFHASLLLLCVLLAGPAAAQKESSRPGSLDTVKIERLTGIKGKLDPAENVFKVTVPRADLKVTVAGVKMIPPMGLASWAAFAPSGAATQVVGDMVLLEDQVSPAMDAALEGGLEVTALHNHFLWDTPRVMYMHIAGQGDEEKLAAAVGRLFAKIAETAGGRGQTPRVAIDSKKSTLGTALRNAGADDVSDAQSAGTDGVAVGEDQVKGRPAFGPFTERQRLQLTSIGFLANDVLGIPRIAKAHAGGADGCGLVAHRPALLVKPSRRACAAGWCREWPGVGAGINLPA